MLQRMLRNNLLSIVDISFRNFVFDFNSCSLLIVIFIVFIVLSCSEKKRI